MIHVPQFFDFNPDSILGTTFGATTGPGSTGELTPHASFDIKRDSWHDQHTVFVVNFDIVSHAILINEKLREWWHHVVSVVVAIASVVPVTSVIVGVVPAISVIVGVVLARAVIIPPVVIIIHVPHAGVHIIVVLHLDCMY